ncbi:YhcN/YlaJ family sporulation lipoprotein [Bacillus carboniphilus]|uniref:YhcN/YlaJ family sporulation lipoprotein n=1 Tax=Bacillus carboniphilus TaxID=86663 RepID=A0ABY9JYZ6_9BACI|nr:YhcN/YlaJ family sporulation lipoprotein [Bacillus carboniphilus]WLR43665.1 YhcN/YlaJ family sporulation lipoprotein [Bacillus carboniphilus]
MTISHKICIACMLLLVSCSNQQAESNGKENKINVRNTAVEKTEQKTGQDIAKHLVSLANDNPDVNDATAIVIGNFAVVGIDVNSKIDRSKVETIKYTVAETLKKDPYGANSVIIADPDTNERLRAMGKEIANGRPIAGILDELAAITGRIIPDVPKEQITPDKKLAPDAEKDQLDNQEEQNIDEIQNKQSNDYLKDQ